LYVQGDELEAIPAFASTLAVAEVVAKLVISTLMEKGKVIVIPPEKQKAS